MYESPFSPSVLWVPRMSDLSAFSCWESLRLASHRSAAGLPRTNHIQIQRRRAAFLWPHLCVNLVFVFVVWVTGLWWSSGWSWICYPGYYQTCDPHQVIFQRTVIMCVSHHTWLSSRVRAYLQVHSWCLRNTSKVMAEGWVSSSSTESTLKFHWKLEIHLNIFRKTLLTDIAHFIGVLYIGSIAQMFKKSVFYISPVTHPLGGWHWFSEILIWIEEHLRNSKTHPQDF